MTNQGSLNKSPIFTKSFYNQLFCQLYRIPMHVFVTCGSCLFGYSQQTQSPIS